MLWKRVIAARHSSLRSFCSVRSTVDDAVTKVPLDQPLPHLPEAVYLKPTKSYSESRVTTLDNGLRVASEPRFGQFCTVGVCIDSGSRYEVAYPSGVSHFLEKLAFNSTVKFKSKDHIQQRLEKFGGIIDCQSTRDTFLYASSVDSRGLSDAVEIIADVVMRPQFTDEEIQIASSAIAFELEDNELKPDQEPFTTEAIHAAAFGNNTMGLPKFCPKDNISVINQKILYNFVSNYYSPERIVLAGVGVDHDQLVHLAQKYFVDEQPIWGKETGSRHQDKSVAQYTGGLVTKEKDLSNVSLGPTPMPELAHLVIGLESVAHTHEDFVPFCVLNMLMGGGGSFSAGGPGKGMYTRLYTHVLNRYHWMYSATAFNHAYADSGIFCINASGHPSQLPSVAQIIIREMVILTEDIDSVELERAKTQLKSMLLMNLESRPVIFEDLARQVLALGQRQRPEVYIDKINQVTKADINRIAKKMLSSKPAVAAVGSLKYMPSYEDITSGLLSKNGQMPIKKQFSLFR